MFTLGLGWGCHGLLGATTLEIAILFNVYDIEYCYTDLFALCQMESIEEPGVFIIMSTNDPISDGIHPYAVEYDGNSSYVAYNFYTDSVNSTAANSLRELLNHGNKNRIFIRGLFVPFQQGEY